MSIQVSESLSQVLADVPAGTLVVVEGSGYLRDWRGEVRDGQNVLVLYAGEVPHWRPAVNGGGKHPWFLIWSDERVPVDRRYYFKQTAGPLRLVRFASAENAQRAADKLNALAVTA